MTKAQIPMQFGEAGQTEITIQANANAIASRNTDSKYQRHSALLATCL